jgi:hypothetical protein
MVLSTAVWRKSVAGKLRFSKPDGAKASWSLFQYDITSEHDCRSVDSLVEATVAYGKAFLLLEQSFQTDNCYFPCVR